MRLLLLPIAVLTATGCANAPISYHAMTPQTADGSYTCAVRKVNELGYTVTNTNKEARFVTGEKQTSGAMTKVMLGKTYHDQLTVSIFDMDSTSHRIRVTAASVEETSNIFSTSKTGKKPSDSAMADANTLLTACSSGPITKEGGGQFEGASQ